MIFAMTLVPNRVDQRRYLRLIRYVREGDAVVPHGIVMERGVVVKSRRLSWNQIKPTQAEPELVAAWKSYVRTRERADKEAA